jgi:NADP-dependent 3-hydroxy acid dehydrogenase YdfG
MSVVDCVPHGALAGKTAVVTGAGSGVGQALARAIHAAGATVILIGRQRARLQETADGLANARVCPLDVRQDAAITALAEGLETVAVLAHAAAEYRRAPLASAGSADFDALYETNLRGPFVMTRALLPALKRAGGDVVFMNSSAALSAATGAGQYGALKAGLKGLADTFRAEHNCDGIRVTSIFLGRVATPMQAAVHAVEGKPYHPARLLQAEDVARLVLAVITLPRTAEVTEIHLRHMFK